MKIYDSRRREKVDFEPIDEKNVKMYVCGPTVYDVAHLGHGRSAVAFDVIRRYFLASSYDVTFVSNFTDIEDKMINRANEEGISVKELADKIIPEYFTDYDALGIKRPDVQPLATEYIDAIVELIEKLMDKGYAYVLDDGVYFDVSKYEKYGELSGQNLEDLKIGARVAVNEDKKNPYDFVLWKFKKEGEPSWESPWGEGRPGWHIECSAMTWKVLGEKFDIHGGGLDLKFPHHECEIAQSCGAFGDGSFAQYWMHNGFINVDNEKMSKSLGNFFTLKDVFKKYDPQVVRFMFLQTHYRNPINFSDKLLDQAKAGLAKIHDFVRKLEVRIDAASGIESTEDFNKMTISAEQSFSSAMDNDFDTSGALGGVYELMKSVNTTDSATKKDLDSVKFFLNAIDEVLGVIFPRGNSNDISDEAADLIKEREGARAGKDFESADRIRAQLKEMGVEIEDTSDGTIWKLI